MSLSLHILIYSFEVKYRSLCDLHSNGVGPSSGVEVQQQACGVERVELEAHGEVRLKSPQLCVQGGGAC